MNIAYFQTLFARSNGDLEIGQKFCLETVPLLLGRPEIISLSVYTPGQTADPYVDGDKPPTLVVQLNLPHREALNGLFGSSAVTTALSPAADAMATFDVFDVVSFGPVDDVHAPQRVAPVSYNVRYYPPIDNPVAFVDHYMQSHVPILRQLPLVRNILCYLPIAWSHPAGVENSGCMLGNEVVFDTFEDLEMALASDVRHRLRRDFEAFPVRPGRNTHDALWRQDFG